MSGSFPGTDFRPPGLTHGSLLERRLVTSIAGAYSTVLNPRRLEHRFYGVWNIILAAIISELGPNVYLVPQYTVDGLVPVAQHLASSITDARAHERIPDFAVVVDILEYLLPYANAKIPRWRRITPVSRRILILVEGKRPPTRRPKDRAYFERSLGEYLWKAHSDLKGQAAKVFQGHADVERLMLVAFSGVWWSWMIYTRELFEAKTAIDQSGGDLNTSTPLESVGNSGSEYNPTDGEAQTDEEVGTKKPKQKKKGRKLYKKVTKGKRKLPKRQVNNPLAAFDQTLSHVPSRSVFLAQASSGAGPSHPHRSTTNVQAGGGTEPSGATHPRRGGRTRQETKRFEPPPARAPVAQMPKKEFRIRYYHSLSTMEQLHQGVGGAVTVRTGTFSPPILFGSSISNQALYIIHDWLQKEIDKYVVHPVGEANGEESQQDVDGRLTESDPENWSDTNTNNEVDGTSETESPDESEVGPEESEVEPEETEEENVVDSDAERSWVLRF